MMTTAAAAQGGTIVSSALKTRYRPSRLASALRIAPAKRAGAAQETEKKYVAIVLRPGMRQSEFRRIERRLARHKLASLPVLVGASGRKNPPNAPICGMIVVGSHAPVRPHEQSDLAAAVRDASERAAPILALSDAAPLALNALGEPEPEKPLTAVLITDGVKTLAAQSDIDRAVDLIAASPAR